MTLPTVAFSDGFESGSLQSSQWAVREAGILEFNDPIGDYSAALWSCDKGLSCTHLQSTNINLASFDSAELRFRLKKDVPGYPPLDSTQDLRVEYRDSGGNWKLPPGGQIDQSSVFSTSFRTFAIDLPANALHETFRVRFLHTGAQQAIDGFWDLWQIDEVYVRGNLVPVVNGISANTVNEGSLTSITVSASSLDDSSHTYLFDLDDDGVHDKSSSSSTLKHAFADSGSYTVRAKVRDSYGVESTWRSVTVDVRNVAPSGVITLEGDDTVPEGSTVYASISGSDPAGSADPLTYQWNVYRGTGSISLKSGTSRQVSFTAPDDGNYRIEAVIRDDEGLSTRPSVNFTATNVRPTIEGIDLPGQVTQGESFSVSVTASDPGSSYDPLTYEFDFDSDGVFERISSSSSVSGILDDPGIATITARVTDDEGKSDTLATEISVLSIAPPPNDTPDSLPRVYFSDRSQTVSEETETFEIAVKLNKAVESEVVLPLSFSGTATLNADIQLPASITIAPGQTGGVVTATMLDDNLAEPIENLTIELLPTAGVDLSGYAQEPISQTIFITSDDVPAVQFTAANRRVNEGDATPATFALALPSPAEHDVHVTLDYAGDAIEGDDVAFLAREVVIPAGAASASVSYWPVDDAVSEPEEALAISIQSAYLALADGSQTPIKLGTIRDAKLTIQDDDEVYVAFAEPLQRFWEDNSFAEIPLMLSNIALEPVSVTVKLIHLDWEDYRDSGTDYDDLVNVDLVRHQVQIPAGQLAASVPLSWEANALPNEHALVLLAIESTKNASIAPTSVITKTVSEVRPIYQAGCSCWGGATFTYEVEEFTGGGRTEVEIRDDDPEVFVLDRIISEGEAADSNAIVTVSLSHPTYKQLEVPLLLSGTATLGEDYDFSGSKLLTFDPNVTVERVPLQILDDDLFEVREQIIVSAYPTFANAASGTITVLDDETLTIGLESDELIVIEGQSVDAFITLSRALDSPIEAAIEYWSGDEWREAFTFQIPSGGQRVTLNLPQPDDYVQQLQVRSGLYRLTVDANVEYSPYRQYTVNVIDDDITVGTAWRALYGSLFTGILGPLEDTPLVDLAGENSEHVAFVELLAAMRGASSQLSQSTLFFDTNRNGIVDNGEQAIDTGLDGLAILELPAFADVNNNYLLDFEEGRWALIGGRDAATGLPLRGVLTAPAGSYIVSPLTTLMSNIVDHYLSTGRDPSLRQISSRVGAALELPPVNLGSFDAAKGVSEGNVDAADVYVAQTLVANTVAMIAALVSALPNGPSRAVAENTGYQELSSRIHEFGTFLELQDASSIESVLRGVLLRTGLTTNDSMVASIATVIAATNTLVSDLAFDNPSEFLVSVSAAKTVVRRDIELAIRQLATGQLSESQFSAAYPPSEIASKIETSKQTVGNPVAPTVTVSDTSVVEGDDESTWAEFEVSLSSPTRIPVEVSIATRDVTASTEGNDYIAKSERLAWTPNDELTKRFRVEILPDTQFENDEQFGVVLFDAVNTEVRNFSATATILNDEPLVYEAPTDGVENNFVLTFADDLSTLTRNDEVVWAVNVDETPISILGADGVPNSLHVSIDDAQSVPNGIISFDGRGSGQLELESVRPVQRVVQGWNGADGQVLIDGRPLNFAGILEVVDQMDAVSRKYEILSTQDSLIEISDDSDAANNFSQLVVTGGVPSPLHHFASPLDKLGIQAGKGQDQILVRALDSNFEGDLEIHAGPGDDSITIIETAGARSLSINGGEDSDQLIQAGDFADSLLSVAAAGGPYSALEGTELALNATATTDEQNTTVAYAWDIDGDGQFDDAKGLNPLLTPEQLLPLGLGDDGSYVVSLKVTDNYGESDVAPAVVTISNAPVSFENVVLNAPVINENGTATVTGSFTDLGSLDTHEVVIDWGDRTTSDATVDPVSRTFTAAHQYLDDDPSATPSDNYTVALTVTDDDTGVGTASTTVTVANVDPASTVIDPTVAAYVFAVGDVRNFSTAGHFMDVGTKDTHAAKWSLAHAVNETVVQETRTGTVSQGSGRGSVSDDFSFSDPGVYTVVLTVTDDDGGLDTSEEVTFVVYDPSEGFVTGGGWIDSPEGALTADPALTGRANFGFVSKYKKGATTPIGQTQFQFKVAGLNFHSDSYEWLVVAGARAQYKGVGTINGKGSYGFMLTAIDGDVNGGGADKFRIKIWDKDNGDAIVYDNQIGTDDDSAPNIELSGGQIKIHKKGDNLIAAGGVAAGAALTPETLQSVVAEAVAGWVDAGVSPIRHTDLLSTQVHMAALPDKILGIASASTNHVWLDVDGASLGWSVPGVDGGYDLLSAVTHELGHVIGLDHDELGETLKIGEHDRPFRDRTARDEVFAEDGLWDGEVPTRGRLKSAAVSGFRLTGGAVQQVQASLVLGGGDGQFHAPKESQIPSLVGAVRSDDRLTGGDGLSLVLGGSRRDFLKAGRGRDILVGRLGNHRRDAMVGRDPIAGGRLNSYQIDAFDAIGSLASLVALQSTFGVAREEEIDGWVTGTDDFFGALAWSLDDDERAQDRLEGVSDRALAYCFGGDL